MPTNFRKTKSGVTATARDTGKTYHSANMSDAEKAAKLREEFKHIKETHPIFKKKSGKERT